MKLINNSLPAEARERLDKVSALPRRYPRAMEETMAERRIRAVRQRSIKVS